jgi:hypothetical protein
MRIPRKANPIGVGKDDKIKMLEKAVGSRSEVKLADLKTSLNVSTINQCLAGFNLPKTGS